MDNCAPGRIRTLNNGSEDRCDIHFTTGANNKYIIALFYLYYKYLYKIKAILNCILAKKVL